MTAGAVYNAVFHLTDSAIPKNSGAYRPIYIIAPPGTVANVVYPGPSVGGNTETHPKLVDMVTGALAPVMREKVAAAEGASACNFLFGGVHPKTGEFYANYHLEGCGWGAKDYDDGNDCTIVVNGNCRNTPVEIFETRYPLETVEYSLIQDSGGAGRHRGGLGTRRIMRIGPGAEVTASALFDRTKGEFSAWGLEGGQPGGYGAIRVKRAGETEFRTFQEVYGTVSASKFTNIVLREGDEVMLDAPGGGGFGDPLERDRDAVARDLEEGIVSAGAARELYGWDDGVSAMGRWEPIVTQVWDTVVTPCDCCGQVVAKRLWVVGGRRRGAPLLLDALRRAVPDPRRAAAARLQRVGMFVPQPSAGGRAGRARPPTRRPVRASRRWTLTHPNGLQHRFDEMRPGLGERVVERGGQLLGGRRLDRGHAHAAGERDPVQRRRAEVGQRPDDRPGLVMPARCISIARICVAAVRDDDRRDVEALARLRPQRLQRVIALPSACSASTGRSGQATARRSPSVALPDRAAGEREQRVARRARRGRPVRAARADALVDDDRAVRLCGGERRAERRRRERAGLGAGGGGAGAGSGPSATPRCSARRSSASTPSWPGALSATIGRSGGEISLGRSG